MLTRADSTSTTPSGPSWLRILAVTSRFHGGRLRRWLTRNRPRLHAPLRLQTVRPDGVEVTLRPPRFADAPSWRAIRLRNRAIIEPHWPTEGRSWEKRHSDTAWIRECLAAQAGARTGASLHMVIEVDGQFAGQVNLEWIDPFTAGTEVGIWMDATHARTGVLRVALNLIVRHAFDTLGLERVHAPISVHNLHALAAAPTVGFVREGVLAKYLDVGGGRTDHELWVMTPQSWAAAQH